MKVILFLYGVPSQWDGQDDGSCARRNIPATLASGQCVLEVVDGVAGTLADGTLEYLVSKCARHSVGMSRAGDMTGDDDNDEAATAAIVNNR